MTKDQLVKICGIVDPIFKSRLMLFSSKSKAIFLDYAKKRYDVELIDCGGIATTWGITRKTKTGNEYWNLLWFSKFDTRNTVFYHEILHAVFNTLRWVGIPLTIDTEEAYTYLFDYYVETLTGKIQ